MIDKCLRETVTQPLPSQVMKDKCIRETVVNRTTTGNCRWVCSRNFAVNRIATGNGWWVCSRNYVVHYTAAGNDRWLCSGNCVVNRIAIDNYRWVYVKGKTKVPCPWLFWTFTARVLVLLSLNMKYRVSNFSRLMVDWQLKTEYRMQIRSAYNIFRAMWPFVPCNLRFQTVHNENELIVVWYEMKIRLMYR